MGLKPRKRLVIQCPLLVDKAALLWADISRPLDPTTGSRHLVCNDVATREQAMNVTESFSDLLTEAAVAAAHGVSQSTLRAWRRAGSGPAFVKFGKRVLYRRTALATWAAGREYQSTEDHRMAQVTVAAK